LTDCDALVINGKIFSEWWIPERINNIFERLAFFQSTVDKIIYLDATDSSGTIQTRVLPYVTWYGKPFLLKDRNIYLKKLYGGRIFTDYYANKFGIRDKEDIADHLNGINDPGHLNKLTISWNPGFTFRILNNLMLMKIPYNRYYSPSTKRSSTVTARITANYARATVSCQREKLTALLDEMNISTSRLPQSQYWREMRNSRIGVSPFGHGEFSFRDFEIFINGCLLYKPDLSHLETWPDWYRANETYVPFKWDFSDFKGKLQELIDDPVWTRQIASAGQERFRWFNTETKAQEEFVKRWRKLLGKPPKAN
jgi:hypothetical protein